MSRRLLLFVTIAVLGAIFSVCVWASPTGKTLYEDWTVYQRVKQGTIGSEDTTTAAATIGFYLAYIIGTADGLLAAGKTDFALPKDADPEQLGFVVGKYLENHPAEWGDHSALLIWRALRLAFPATR